MKKILLKTLLLVVVLLSAGTTNAQWQNGLWTGKQAYNWYFPVEAGINFDTSPPTAVTNSVIFADPLDGDPNTETTATISDVNGNLLFYTNGVTVWNKNHQVMQNGTGLLGDVSGGQGALIVPKPENPGIYYIFTTGTLNTLTYTYDGVKYSEVDMTLNNGLGAVTENKNITILQPAPPAEKFGWGNEEKMTSVHHSNGVDVWVAVRQDNAYCFFLVTAAGVTTSPQVSRVGTGNMNSSSAGQMKFSHDGRKLAVVNPIPQNTLDNYTEVFNFDNTTGILTGPVVSIPTSLLIDVNFDYFGMHGIEFSPNGRYLYVVGFFFSQLYQFDLLAGNEQSIIDSRILLYQNLSISPYVKANQLQTGPDGKIYMSNFTFNFLHVIDYPNNAGLAAGFDANGTIDLAGKEGGVGITNFIQSYFESGILHEGECATQAVSFSTIRIPGIESIVWDFGDPASGADNASTSLEPAHTYLNAGTYTVTAIITSNGAQQTATSTVTILPAPVAVAPQGATLVQCADANGNSIFNLNQFNNTLLAGQDASAFTVAYYASEADLQANTPIANTANFTTTGQTVYAKVINNSTGCYTNTSFPLVVNPMPAATTPGTIELCANTTGEAVFNLTQQNAVILGNQDTTLFTVTYYASQQDVQDNIPIAAPEAFASSGQTIYTVVTNNATGCTVNTQFEIVAVQPPVIAEAIEYTGCSPFNLIAISAQQGENLILTFYVNENDAIAGTNAIADATRYTDPDNKATLYIIATNAQGCKDMSILTLNTGNCTIPRGISPNNDGFNDRFDLSGFDVEQLSIFNRYGAEVFSLTNYTDQWHGQSDNNNELPTGTYYYSIQTNTGEQKTGWVYINREAN
jgi:gliding motility-associated-like protein